MIAVASQTPGNNNDVLHIYGTYMFAYLQKVWEVLPYPANSVAGSNESLVSLLV
jgi:hypothetical protein